MPNSHIVLAALVSLAAMAGAPSPPPALAQTTEAPNPPDPMQAPPGVQPGQSLDPSGGMYSTEERDRVREAVREDETLVKGAATEAAPSASQATEAPAAIVGRPLPPTLPARRAPDSLIAKLPSRPNHEVWIFENNLALVDKETREVTDIVRDIF